MRRTTKLGSCIAGCLIAAVSLQSTLLSHWCVRRNAGAAAARARTGSGAAPRAAPISAAPPRSVAARLAADDADESRLERLLSRRLAAAPRYAARADGASTVECTLFGKRAPHADAADCHGEPPFTNWWHDYRTCYATNVCLREGVLSYYDGDAARPRERIGSPLACTDWRATQQGQHVVERRAGRPARASADVVWYDAPVLHGSELMGGHFGHDVAQNLLFAYSTLWHANLTAPAASPMRAAVECRHVYNPRSQAWLEPGAGVKPVHFVYDANPRRPAVLADVFDRVAYARGTPAWPKTHCFKLAMLSPLHDFGADLQWHRNSPSTEKKLVWRGYRNLLLRHACPDCAAALGKRGRLARNDRCVGNASGAVVSVFKRSHDGKTSNLLTANGRGRRITNHAAVVAALQEALPGGAVEDVDPSLMTLAKQQALMAKTDVVVTRMASQVLNAMFLGRGSTVVEVEVPDPARLYYDHPALTTELCDIFGLDFRRSTARSDASAIARGAKIFGSVDGCKRSCRGPPQLQAFANTAHVDACCKRCEAVAAAAAQPQNDGDDTYQRDEWYRNWWLQNGDADVEDVVDLVVDGLARACDGAAAADVDEGAVAERL